jgi:hypothetical protein
MAWFDPVQITDKLQPSVYGTMALMAVFAGLAQIDIFLALGIFAAALAALLGRTPHGGSWTCRGGRAGDDLFCF